MRGGSKARQELLRYLPAPNPTTVLVLVQSAGEKHDPELARLATTVAVEPLPPERVARWVAHRAKQVGLEIEPDAIAALVEIAGPGLGALAQELDKLAAVTAGDRKSTRLNSSHVRISYAVFCLKKKKKKTQEERESNKGTG